MGAGKFRAERAAQTLSSSPRELLACVIALVGGGPLSEGVREDCNRSEKGGHRDVPRWCLWSPFTPRHQTQGENAFEFNLHTWSYSAVLGEDIKPALQRGGAICSGAGTAGRSVVG